MQERTSILFEKVKEDKISDMSSYLENDDGFFVVFRGETLTFTMMLLKF